MFDYDKLLHNKLFVSDFRIPYGEGDEFEADGYDRPASDAFCNSVGTRCPFPLLQYYFCSYIMYQYVLFGTANTLHVQLLFKTQKRSYSIIQCINLPF